MTDSIICDSPQAEHYNCSHLNMTEEDENIIDPFAMPTWRKLAWSIFFFLMVAAADIGNIIVIWIVLSHARMRSVTNYFIVNLSIADIMNATFNVIPNFTYMLTGNWPFGLVCCKVVGYISILSVCVSVFTLVAISVDRYNAIINPLRPRLSKFRTLMAAGATWVTGLSLGVPMFAFFITYEDMNNRTQCIPKYSDVEEIEEIFESKQLYWYNVTFMILTYFLPVTVMCYTYSRVGLELWGSRAIGEASEAQTESIKSKRKVVKMMMMVVLIFIVCWLPYHTYFITANIYPEINYSIYIQEIYLMIYWLAMSNSMYNPMIYCYMNQRFRKGFEKVLSSVICCIKENTIPDREPPSRSPFVGSKQLPNGANLPREANKKSDFADRTARPEPPSKRIGVEEERRVSSSSSEPASTHSNGRLTVGHQQLRGRARDIINITRFLNQSPQTVIKVENLQVNICDGKSESLCLSETEIVTNSHHSDSSDSMERQKLTPPRAKTRGEGEMLLHPDVANKIMETSLNLPEIIGRKEKLV